MVDVMSMIFLQTEWRDGKSTTISSERISCFQNVFKNECGKENEDCLYRLLIVDIDKYGRVGMVREFL